MALRVRLRYSRVHEYVAADHRSDGRGRHASRRDAHWKRRHRDVLLRRYDAHRYLARATLLRLGLAALFRSDLCSEPHSERAVQPCVALYTVQSVVLLEVQLVILLLLP